MPMPFRISHALKQLQHRLKPPTLGLIAPLNQSLSAESNLTTRSLSPDSAQHKRLTSPIFVIAAIASLTTMMGQRFYNEPALDVGRVAPHTILAPLKLPCDVWRVLIPKLLRL